MRAYLTDMCTGHACMWFAYLNNFYSDGGCVCGAWCGKCFAFVALYRMCEW